MVLVNVSITVCAKFHPVIFATTVVFLRNKALVNSKFVSVPKEVVQYLIVNLDHVANVLEIMNIVKITLMFLESLQVFVNVMMAFVETHSIKNVSKLLPSQGVPKVFVAHTNHVIPYTSFAFVIPDMSETLTVFVYSFLPLPFKFLDLVERLVIPTTGTSKEVTLITKINIVTTS